MPDSYEVGRPADAGLNRGYDVDSGHSSNGSCHRISPPTFSSNKPTDLHIDDPKMIPPPWFQESMENVSLLFISTNLDYQKYRDCDHCVVSS